MYDYRFIKNIALHADWAAFISLKRSEVHPSNKQYEDRGGRRGIAPLFL